MSQYIHYPNESGGGSSITVTDTNSVGLTLAGTVLSADVSISSNAADAGNLVVPIDIESTGVVGLRAQVSNAGIRALFSGVSPILYNSSTGAVSIQVATTAQNGYLSSTDWNTFNGKQVAGNYITALTGDATASGPGSVALTLTTVNGNVGSFGTATQVGSFTVNAKGLITAAVNTSIQIAESQVTNLVSDLAGKQPVGNYITALTGDVVATGPGSVSATIQPLSVTAAKIANLTITNAQIDTAASISMSKLQALTSNRAVATDGTGHITSTSVTDTEQGYLSGVTSSIQTQLNALPTYVPWTSFTMVIEATGSNPTKGSTTVDAAFYRRIGDTMEIRYNFEQTGAGAAGSGLYLFLLPLGHSVDTAKLNPDTNGWAYVGGGGVTGGAGGPGNLVYAYIYDSTHIAIKLDAGTNAIVDFSAGTIPLSGANVGLAFLASVPISGWA